MLWPHKKVLGNVLSLGVRGNGLANVVEEKDTTLRLDLQFPRASDEPDIHSQLNGSTTTEDGSNTRQSTPRRWAPIHNGRYVLLEPIGTQCSPTVVETVVQKKKSNTRNNQNPIPKQKQKQKHQSLALDSYVPQQVIRSSLVESNAVLQNAYDPTFKALFAITTLSSGIQKIAHVAGENGTSLVVSELNVQPQSTPEIASDPLQIDFNEPIKHVEWSTERVPETPPTNSRNITVSAQYYLLVVTDTVVYLFEANTLLMELSAVDLKGVSFATATFSPVDPRLFAAVDKDGHYFLWHLDKGIVHQGKHLQDPHDLSSWKGVCWGYNASSLYVSSRSGMCEYDVADSTKKYDIITTTNTWSRILHFEVCLENREYGFLLTTKELIMVKTTPTTTREVAWKHYLADNDPSLKFSLLEYTQQRTILLAIYSTLHETVIVYEFAFKEDGRPVMAADPYIVKHGAVGGIQYLQLVDLLEMYHDETEQSQGYNNVAGLFEMNTRYGLAVTLLSDEKGTTLTQSRDGTVAAKTTERHRVFHHLSKRECSNLVRNLQKILNTEIGNRDPEIDIELVQDYAYKLGSSVGSIGGSNSKKSLLDLAHEVPLSEDLEEFDSMIEQLVAYFETKNIALVSSNLERHFEAENLEAVFNRYMDYLKNDHTSVFGLSRFATLMGLSLIRSHKKLQQQEENDDDEMNITFNKELENANENIKNLLELWDNTEYQETEQPTATQDELPTQVDEIPTIRITQSQTQSQIRRRNSQRPSQTSSPRSQMSIQLGSQSSDVSPRKLLLGSSQRFGLSQALSLSQRSQGPPKRKKRRGGFG